MFTNDEISFNEGIGDSVLLQPNNGIAIKSALPDNAFNKYCQEKIKQSSAAAK